MEYYWEDTIKYKEFLGLNIHKLIDEYKKFLKNNEDSVKTGTAVIFVDNPFNIIRALTKKLLKRGVGYKYREIQ